MSLILVANAKISDKYIWIRELHDIGYKAQEIVDLLWDSVRDSPWIFFNPTCFDPCEIQAYRHIPECCHEIFLRSSKTPNFEHSSLTTDHKRMVESIQELCGLAGISPTTRSMKDWIGSIHFSNENHCIKASYTLTTDESYSTNFELLCSRIARALGGLCHALALTQANNLCCNSFTFIKDGAHKSPDAPQGEVISVAFKSVIALSDALHQVIASGSRQPSLATLKYASEAILGLVWPGVARFQTESNSEWCLHLCAVAVQFLCVGFLSYSQAHIGPFQPFFLDSPFSHITLSGLDREPKYPQLIAELVDLTCLGGMTDGPVLIFRANQDSSYLREQEASQDQPVSRKYDILGQTEDILDTWGPGCLFFQSDSNEHLLAIKIATGWISAGRSGKCHWSREMQDIDGLSSINVKHPLLIGSLITTNITCRLDETECWRLSEGVSYILGTSPSIYTITQRQVAVGGGQFMNAQVSQTWNKQRGVTVKDVALNSQPKILQYLDHYWGVQVSYCTGVARRVPLRTLVADLIEHFCIGSDLDLDIIKCKLRDQSKGPKELEKWMKSLHGDVRNSTSAVIYEILHTLGPTGVDLSGNYLCVAWPFEGITNRCFKIPLEANSSWAKFLEDSQDFATFAYVTTECFQTENIQCSGRFPEACQNIHFLETGVSRARDLLHQSPLQHEEICFFSKLESMFWVKVLKESEHQPASLVRLVTISSIPYSIRQKLYRYETQKQRNCLRERSTAWAPGEVVSVFSGRDRVSVRG